MRIIFALSLAYIYILPLTASDNKAYSLEKDLVVVDVGCRWGFADKFMSNINQFQLYGFDPDKQECERLTALYNSNRVHLIPLGLANYEGSANLFVTRNPACSSMYEPNQELIENCRPTLDCMEKVDQIEMKVTTLDKWAKQSSVEYIDHIKLDTQGSELLILQGGATILNTVRSIEVEVEFNSLYKDQPLFSDVDAFLRKHGFVLWKFTNLIHYGHSGEHNMKLSPLSVFCSYGDLVELHTMRGGQLYWADAHYVRAEMTTDKLISYEQLIRDIMLSESLGFFDLAQRLKTKITSMKNEQQN